MQKRSDWDGLYASFTTLLSDPLADPAGEYQGYDLSEVLAINPAISELQGI